MIDRVIGALGGSDRPLDTLANWALVNHLVDLELAVKPLVDRDLIDGLLVELASTVRRMANSDSMIDMSTSYSFPKRSKVTFSPNFG